MKVNKENQENNKSIMKPQNTRKHENK